MLLRRSAVAPPTATPKLEPAATPPEILSIPEVPKPAENPAATAPPKSENGFYSEDASILYNLMQSDLAQVEERIINRLRPFLAAIVDKTEGKTNRELQKNLGEKPKLRVCICNVEGKLAVNYRKKLEDLPITIDFVGSDQHKSSPAPGHYDLVVYTREGGHKMWEILQRDYPKDKLIYCDKGITRVIERIKDWLDKQSKTDK